MTDRCVSDIYKEWYNRRNGVLRALTTDVESFANCCPPHREGLCLYGNIDGTWQVGPPPYEVPPVIPEPCNGINCARDSLDRLQWLAFVAAHSESWLFRLVFFKSIYLSSKQREELFLMMNREPTILELLTNTTNSHSKEENQPPLKRLKTEKKKTSRQVVEEANGWQDGDGDPCPICKQHYKQGNFWICCDYCETWFCGKCVKLDESSASKFRKWKCPLCP